MDRQLLARATENSDAPTPGYMYLDIAKNAASNPATCADIAKYLTNRLASKNNYNIKYKCLKVISKTCTSPYLRGQFKRCLSQDPNSMTAIKDSLQFRGPPDPVRGDEPYERVRTAAKESLDAVYSDTPQDNGGGTPFATSASASYGPSPDQQSFGGGGGGPSGSGGIRRMDGIGNPMFSDPRMEPQTRGIGNMTVKDVVSEARETVIGMMKDPLARNGGMNVGDNHSGSMPRPGGSYGGPGGYSGPPPGRSELMHQTGGQWTMASNRGPSAVAPPPNYSNDSAYYKSRDNGNAYAWAQKGSAASGGVGGSWASAAPSVSAQAREPYQHQATPSIAVTGGMMPSMPSGGGAAVADGSYEKQLIMELCPPGGMKAEPPPDKLNQFSRSVASLNPDLICPVLLDCLEDGQPWIIRAKALCVIEACMRHGQKPGAASNAYTDFFHACSGEIAPLANHNRAQIRDPAKRILSLMGVAVPSGTTSPPVSAPMAAPPAAAPPAPVQNLLNFDDTPAPASATQASGKESLFGSLNVATSDSARPVASATSATAPPPSSGNLLGDWLSDGTSIGDASAAAPPPSNGSLFGDMKVKDPSSSAPAPTSGTDVSSMFENMSLKTEEAPNTNESSTHGGSAFGFINQTASVDSQTEKKSDTASNSQASDSFDPLKTMTPNTAQKMMQVSPEQMQAMMYQQMMMQQQMKMAQMMAMQQQQSRHGSGGMYMPQMQGVMQNNAAASKNLAFMDKPVRTEDKKFDFIQDAMSMEKKK